MNNKIFVAIIIIALILGLGGYFFVKPQKIVQSHRSYKIELISDTANIKPDQKIIIKYKIKNDKGEILKNYETVHEKIMHFIIVRKDLQYFQHLHPDFNKSVGEFSVEITFPQDGQYRLFPDFTPGQDNPQKLPVTVYHDVDVGNSSKYYAQSVVPDREQVKTYGDYEITTTFPKDAKKQTEIMYSLNIAKNGKSVTNLENYLGALGHSVILKEGTLDFIHTHALGLKGNTQRGHGVKSEHGSTGDIARGPKVSFATTFPQAGIYKIFTQFQHEGKVQIADYVIEVN